MSQPRILDDAKKLAVEIDVGIRALPIHNTPSEWAVRRCRPHQLRRAQPAFVLALARELVHTAALELPEMTILQLPGTGVQLLGSGLFL